MFDVDEAAEAKDVITSDPDRMWGSWAHGSLHRTSSGIHSAWCGWVRDTLMHMVHTHLGWEQTSKLSYFFRGPVFPSDGVTNAWSFAEAAPVNTSLSDNNKLARPPPPVYG